MCITSIVYRYSSNNISQKGILNGTDSPQRNIRKELNNLTIGEN